MKAIISQEEFNGLPDILKAEYTKLDKGDKAGSFIAKIESVDGYSLEDVSGLKSSLSATRRERDEALSSVKGFEGLKPDEVRSNLAKYEKLLNENPEGKAKEQVEALKRQLVQKHESELKDVQTQLAQRDKEVHDLVVIAGATAALSKNGGSVDLLLPHVISQTKVVRGKDGKPIARILDSSGNERVSMKQGSTDPMDLDEFVGTVIKQDSRFAPAFKGSGAKGTGSSGTDSGAGNGSQPVQFGSYADALAAKRAEQSGESSL